MPFGRPRRILKVKPKKQMTKKQREQEQRILKARRAKWLKENGYGQED
jgi:hypothetical protein